METDNRVLQKIAASVLFAGITVGTFLLPLNQSPLTFDEYKTLVGVYQYEISLTDGIEIDNFSSSDSNLLLRIRDELQKREIVEDLVIFPNGDQVTKDEYIEIRHYILGRIGKKNLFSRISE